MSEVLSLQSIYKSYGSVQALANVSLCVNQGEVYGILGPNGSGKTTLLAIILGATHPSLGSFLWFGEKPDAKKRRRIGSMLEAPAFYPLLSGLANLRILAAIKKISEGEIPKALQTVGLWEERNTAFQNYSLGMKQRLGIAGCILGKPDLLVLDEPTNGVDARGIADIRAIIDNFAKAGGTVILASHILDEVEKVCSHVAILKRGQVLSSGSLNALGKRSWIEISCDHLDALETELKLIDPASRLVRKEFQIELHESSLAPSEINAKLAKVGIFISHLVEKRPSLESQYLDVVEK